MAKQQEDSEDRATLEWPKANDEWSAQIDGSHRMRKSAERFGLSIEPPEEQAMTCLWGCITAKKTT